MEEGLPSFHRVYGSLGPWVLGSLGSWVLGSYPDNILVPCSFRVPESLAANHCNSRSLDYCRNHWINPHNAVHSVPSRCRSSCWNHRHVWNHSSFDSPLSCCSAIVLILESAIDAINCISIYIHIHIYIYTYIYICFIDVNYYELWIMNDE